VSNVAGLSIASRGTAVRPDRKPGIKAEPLVYCHYKAPDAAGSARTQGCGSLPATGNPNYLGRFETVTVAYGDSAGWAGRGMLPGGGAPASPTRIVGLPVQSHKCNRTFRHYPSGVTRADQSQRRPLRGAAVAWALGLSTRSAGFARAAEGGWLFDKFGAGIGKSTALRDVRTVSEQQRKVRVLGLDGTLVKIRGQERC